jgi:ABC-type transport system involved in multi-copper enzyme maturation permease subunit
MFRLIILKEIRQHLLSFRFLAVAILLLVFVPATVLILTNDAVREQDDYSRRQADIEAYLAQHAHFNRLGNVIAPSQPPVAFLALVRGLTADPNLGSFDDDPLPVMFPLVDLTFIVAVLLSLAALILAYDAVSGEREDGTLKLVLANGVRRATVLWGKVAGGATALFLPFLTAMATGMIIILLNPRIAWRGADWGALAGILAGALVYLGIFIGLGVWISSRHSSSSASILTSLFIWVLIVLVVPNLSPYVASLLRPTPSTVAVGRDIARLTDVERDELGRKLSAERTAAVFKDYPVLAGVERMRREDIQATAKRDPTFAKAYEVYRKENEAAWVEANRVQGAKADVLREDLRRREEAQTKLSVGLSMASPFASFTYLAADLSNTGMRNTLHFGRMASAYWSSYRQYAQKKMDEMRASNPTLDHWNTAVDVRDMPRFAYREEALASRCRAAVVPFLLLAGLALAVFVAAVLSFNRSDVR